MKSDLCILLFSNGFLRIDVEDALKNFRSSFRRQM